MFVNIDFILPAGYTFNMINDLKELIAINSVAGKPEPRAPFGSGPRRALDWFLTKAASYGLKTGEDEGYCGWAEYGEGKLVGVLAHLDIVPIGTGWATDPLTATIENGNLYGRGAIDDKGPAVAALHALKSLADNKIKLNGRVRIIAGCNEETGCECMKHYAKHCEVPAVSFTPDAAFPVINSEKGIAHLKIKFAPEKELTDSFAYICGGERPNVVPASAECKITGKLAGSLASNPPADLLRRENIAQRLAEDGVDMRDFYFKTENDLVIGATGTAAHGSTPEKGDNALRKLFSLLSAVTGSPSIKFISEYLAPKDADKRLSIAAEDVKSGKLTLNLGIAELTPDGLTATLDIRLPLALRYDELIARITAVLPEGASIEPLHHENNLYVDENSNLVRTLLTVYEKHFGEKGSPIKSGGGTYAKTLPNCVAFGPAPDGEDYHMHDADEYIPVELLFKLVDVYRDAMIALCDMAG